MTAATAPVAVRVSARRAEEDFARFRTDIQGLRAVAVVLVLLYHAGLPWLPGGYVGVDVFFVISGFLITGLIVREIDRTGRLSLARFYARRVRRLLPATAVTFVGVALLTVVALPVTRWASIVGDMVASTLYVVNWRLAARSVDYLQEGAAASPLQHFWSLAVEEQFYVVWPLLIVALVWLARHRVSRRALTIGLLALAVPSLVWSVHLTGANPGQAYFVTTTRLWQLAVGALLAVGTAQAARLPFPVRAAAGWLGLGAIVLAAVSFTSTTPFPGSAALLPTLGAAGVLLAGTGDGSARVRPLDLPVMQDVGALSYSLYLWHWPLLVVAGAVWGDENGTLWLPTALMVVACSAVPAWFTYRTVELPIHKNRALAEKPWRAAVAALVCIAVGLGSAAAVQWSIPRTPPATAVAEDSVPEERVGALVLGEDPAASPEGELVDVVESITPAPVDAESDNADVYSDGCHQDQESAEVTSCVYGDEGSATRVALVGDSHAAHWQPALRALAEEHGWRLETYTKSACLFADVEVWLGSRDQPYTSCTEWSQNVVDELSADPPDVVVVSSSGSYQAVVDGRPASRAESRERTIDGVSRNWAALEQATDVLAVVDTPRASFDLPECIAENTERLSACAFDRADAVRSSGADLIRSAAEQVDGVTLVDLTDWVCPQEECAPVIGGVMVMRDSHHLTGTYARTLAPQLEAEITPLLER